MHVVDRRGFLRRSGDVSAGPCPMPAVGAAEISAISLNWPAENGALLEISLDGSPIWTGSEAGLITRIDAPWESERDPDPRGGCIAGTAVQRLRCGERALHPGRRFHQRLHHERCEVSCSTLPDDTKAKGRQTSRPFAFSVTGGYWSGTVKADHGEYVPVLPALSTARTRQR